MNMIQIGLPEIPNWNRSIEFIPEYTFNYQQSLSAKANGSKVTQIDILDRYFFGYQPDASMGYPNTGLYNMDHALRTI